MMPLRVLVLTTSACLIGTKFLDCYSTMSQLEKPEDELNPLGRAAINRVGKRAAIWGVFLLVVIIVAIVGGTAYQQALGLLEDREPNFGVGPARWTVLDWRLKLRGRAPFRS